MLDELVRKMHLPNLNFVCLFKRTLKRLA